MIASFFIGALLVAAGAVLMLWHRANLLQTRDEQPSERDEEFAWRRFRRRMQASGMMGVVGVAIILGQLPMSPLFALFYWSGVVLVVLWMMLLALADALNSFWHYQGDTKRQQQQRAALTAKLHKLRREQGEEPEA